MRVPDLQASAADPVADDELPAPEGHFPDPSGAGQLVVIGVDLAKTNTGIATPGGVRLVTSHGAKDDPYPARGVRLARIRNAVMRVCEGASMVVIEGPSYGSRDGHQHDRSGLWWLVYRAFQVNEIPVAVVTPSQLKKYATGSGAADKFAVHAAVIKRYPDIEVKGADQADALVLRAMGCDRIGQPIAPVPAINRKVLDNVDWPAVVR